MIIIYILNMFLELSLVIKVRCLCFSSLKVSHHYMQNVPIKLVSYYFIFEFLLSKAFSRLL